MSTMIQMHRITRMTATHAPSNRFRVEHYDGEAVRQLGTLTDVAPHHSSIDPYLGDLLRAGSAGQLRLINETTGEVVTRRRVRRPAFKPRDRFVKPSVDAVVSPVASVDRSTVATLIPAIEAADRTFWSPVERELETGMDDAVLLAEDAVRTVGDNGPTQDLVDDRACIAWSSVPPPDVEGAMDRAERRSTVIAQLEEVRRELTDDERTRPGDGVLIPFTQVEAFNTILGSLGDLIDPAIARQYRIESHRARSAKSSAGRPDTSFSRTQLLMSVNKVLRLLRAAA